MKCRVRVGIIYAHYENWIAGTYYIQNLLRALSTLEDPELPHIVVLTRKRKDFLKLKFETGYPYLSFYRFGKPPMWKRVINKLTLLFLHKKLPDRQPTVRVDALFPNPDRKYFSRVNNRIYWIPDFQEMRLPQFFRPDDILRKRQQTNSIVTRRDHLILSSRDAKRDLVRFYSEPKCPTSIVPFAVTHPDYTAVNIEDVKTDFGIPDEYFLVSNQFWAHKNHIIVLRAIRHLLSEGVHVFVVFTGNPVDHRNPDYYTRVQDYVSEQKISHSVCFTGLIERTRHLRMMHAATAIIQPSLFEGWSTVVEDAMAMNQWIVASSLSVHLEQLEGYPFSTYFDPMSQEELAEKMELLRERPPSRARYNYSLRVKRFADNFMTAVRKTSSIGSELDRAIE